MLRSTALLRVHAPTLQMKIQSLGACLHAPTLQMKVPFYRNTHFMKTVNLLLFVTLPWCVSSRTNIANESSFLP
jgi:hypothetical protein